MQLSHGSSFLQSDFTGRHPDAICFGFQAAIYLEYLRAYSYGETETDGRNIVKTNRETIQRCTGLCLEQQIHVEQILKTFKVLDILDEEEDLQIFIKEENYIKFYHSPYWHREKFEESGAYDILRKRGVLI